MTDQENDQQKPTLQLAWDYVAKLHEISGAKIESSL
jgi:hypothetical protein